MTEPRDKTAKRKRAEEAVRRSERELAIRNRIADIFLTIPEDEVYGEVLQVVLEVLESKHGVFGYIDEEGAIVFPSMTREVWEQCQMPGKDIVFPREAWGGIWGRVLTEKKALYSNEPGRVPEGHIPIERSLGVPIIHQEEVIGLLHVANKPTDYEQRDQDLLEVIAGWIAPILHARLQRDSQERARRRAEQALRSRAAKLKDLNRHLVRAHAQLSKSQTQMAEKSALLQSVAEAQVRSLSESFEVTAGKYWAAWPLSYRLTFSPLRSWPRAGRCSMPSPLRGRAGSLQMRYAASYRRLLNWCWIASSRGRSLSRSSPSPAARRSWRPSGRKWFSP